MDRRAPLSLGCPRQEYWSRLPFPSPGDLPDAGIEPMSPALAGANGKPYQSTEQCILLRKDLKWSRKSLLIIIINSYYCEKNKNAILVYFIEGLLINQSDKANNQGRKWTNARLFSLFFFPFPSYSFHLPSLFPFCKSSEGKVILSKWKEFSPGNSCFRLRIQDRINLNWGTGGGKQGLAGILLDGCDLQGLPFLLMLLLTCSFLMFPTKSIIAFRSNFMAFGVL